MIGRGCSTTIGRGRGSTMTGAGRGTTTGAGSIQTDGCTQPPRYIDQIKISKRIPTGDRYRVKGSNIRIDLDQYCFEFHSRSEIRIAMGLVGCKDGRNGRRRVSFVRLR